MTDMTGVFENAIDAEARRVTTIQVLAGVALATGALIALTAPSSGTSLQLFIHLPWWPWLSGMLLAVFGTVLTIGAFTERPKLAYIGTLLCILWYGAFGLEYILQWLDFVTLQQVVTEEPPIYPVAHYIGFAALHSLSARGVRDRMTREKA